MKYGQNLPDCNKQLKIQQKELEDKRNDNAAKQLTGAVGIQVGAAGVVWGTFGDNLKSYAF
ncbi:hypothetical protein [Providencia alcalifaciens]|uniref:hypothetical protein n=1 Tax=Providencia alcalifaciens TaxID=126385 RepID=UPI002B060021|nr:hypothetical protein [Providencia alcalifaciens]